MKHRTLLGAAIAAAVLASPSQPVTQSATTAFVGVSVLTMDSDAVLADHTVVVSDGKIASVAPRCEGAAARGSRACRRQREVPDAGSGRDARPHPRWRGNGSGSRTHLVSLRRQRHHDYPGHARRSASPRLPRASREGRDRQPAHLHVGPFLQRQDSIDHSDGRRSGHRPEEGRLRLVENSSGCTA